MTVQKVCVFIRDCQGNKPFEHTIEVQEESFTSANIKALRSAAVVFNLSTTSFLRCNFETRRIIRERTKDEVQLGAPFWGSLTLLISAISLSIFGTYRFSHFLIKSYRQAVIDAASGRYGLYIGNTRLRSATTWDLMKGPVSVGFLGAMGVLAALIKATEIFSRAAEEGLTKTVSKVTVKFTEFNRQLPEPLSNQESDDGTAWIDPIFFDEIPKAEACLPRYLHVANVVIGLSNCLKAIFQKDLERDQVNVPRFQHPLEGHRLTIDDMYKLEEEVVETLCIPYSNWFQSQLYDCWTVSVTIEEIRQQITYEHPSFLIDSYPDLNHQDVAPLAIAAQKNLIKRKREIKFLSFFDESVYPYLPAFKPPQADEQNI
ncbi:MAG: hypothetical protein KFB93_04505 [Simkaniaceae bacterium]|nr:MAG: hypothetical protein KFB93_04505 [Simkaniaceae bacterium]